MLAPKKIVLHGNHLVVYCRQLCYKCVGLKILGHIRGLYQPLPKFIGRFSLKLQIACLHVSAFIFGFRFQGDLAGRFGFLQQLITCYIIENKGGFINNSCHLRQNNQDLKLVKSKCIVLDILVFVFQETAKRGRSTVTTIGLVTTTNILILIRYIR